MHSVAVAVSPRGAAGTLAFACPTAVAVLFKAGVPYLPEVVLIYIALVKVGADACAARN